MNPGEECLRAASFQVLERRRVAAADKEPVFVFRQLLPFSLLTLRLRDLLAAALVHVGGCGRRDLHGPALWSVLFNHRNMADRLTQLQDAVNQVSIHSLFRILMGNDNSVCIRGIHVNMY